MAMNKFMHSKNVYNTPANFAQLAEEFEDFRAIAKTNANGKVKIDFEDENALRILTKCLLKRDFNLTVNIPPKQLVPTLPLRLNYILWIEDMVKTFQFENVIGLDIGCGASCIYPLLAAKRNPSWQMFGIELNDGSIKYARENVTENGFNDRIQIIENTMADDPLHALDESSQWQHFDFTMCNPPFFDDESSESTESEDDNQPDCKKSRVDKLKPPNNATTGISCELKTAGGEVEFVKKIIQRSKELRTKITIFTTMLGHKNSLGLVLNELKSHGITNICTSEFCQGWTKRWGVAWTYQNHVLLRKVPVLGQTQPKPPQRFLPNDVDDPDLAAKKLCRILSELSESGIVNHEKIEGGECFEFIALSFAWRNQRRKRRQQARHQTPADDSNAEEKPKDNEESRETDGIPSKPNPKLDANSIVEMIKNSDSPPVLHVAFSVQSQTVSELKAIVEIKLNYLNGSSGLNGVYELLQYIQNKWTQ